MLMKKSKIIDYYNQSEIDYKLVWGLNKNLALHFGYWDKNTKNLSQALERENEILAKLANIKKTDLVLDAGCGVGGSSIYLAKNVGCHVLGITLVKNQVLSAKRNAHKNKVENLTEFKVADFTNTKFQSASFDVVWAIESVCHAKDKADFIKESYQLLKKGGRLIIADFFINKSKLNSEEASLMDNMAHGWAVESFANHIDFENDLKKSGFKKIKKTNASKNIFPSARKLYHRSLPGLAIGKILQFMGIRNALQNANIWTVFYQYKALKQNLWQYYIFQAEK